MIARSGWLAPPRNERGVPGVTWMSGTDSGLHSWQARREEELILDTQERFESLAIPNSGETGVILTVSR